MDVTLCVPAACEVRTGEMFTADTSMGGTASRICCHIVQPLTFPVYKTRSFA